MVESRRAVERKNLIYYLKAIDAVSGRQVGRLADITTKGALLICEQAIAKGTELRLQVALPEKIDGQEAIEFTAVCAFCNVSLNRQFFDVGYRFLHVERKYIPIIEELMEQFAFRDSSVS